MLARFSRSAFICRAIESTRSRGGWMSFSSMRLTFSPHGWVAWSTATSTLALISSRLDSDSSRSIEPIAVRMLVITRLRMAISSWATS